MMQLLEEYLRPNPFLPRPVPTPELWSPPAASRGLRAIGLRSKGPSRVSLVANNNVLDFESRLESLAALAFFARHDTADVVEQAPQVEYVDDHGVVHLHTFDLFVTSTAGLRSAVFVRPSELMTAAVERKLALLAEQMSPRVADEVVPFTELKLTRDDMFNAEYLHDCCREPYPEADAAIAALIAGMDGEVSIADLVDKTGLHGNARRAVVRAIAAGTLRLAAPGRIGPATRVVRQNGRR